jgi:hypothetical protein
MPHQAYSVVVTDALVVKCVILMAEIHRCQLVYKCATCESHTFWEAAGIRQGAASSAIKGVYSKSAQIHSYYCQIYHIALYLWSHRSLKIIIINSRFHALHPPTPPPLPLNMEVIFMIVCTKCQFVGQWGLQKITNAKLSTVVSS